MKIIILCLCLTLAACMPRDRDQSQTHGHDHHDDHDVAIPMSKVYGKARKVPNSSGSSFGGGGRSSSSASEMCPVTCMRQMKSDIENDAQFSEFIEKQSKPYRFDNQFDTSMLNKYCQKMNRTVDCVRPCTEGQLKNMATKALSLPRYMCVETKFTEYAPCYNKVGKQMEKVCHSANKCGPKKTALENDMRRQPATMADIENMLKHTCDYMSCYTECDRPKVIQECGADANRVLEGLYKKSIDVMRDIFATMGVSIQMPSQCNRVGGGGSGSSIDTDEENEDEDTGISSNRGSRPSNRDRDGGDGMTHGTGSRGSQSGGQRGTARGENQGSGRGGSGNRGGNQASNRGTQNSRGGQSGTRRGNDRDQDQDEEN